MFSDGMEALRYILRYADRKKEGDMPYEDEVGADKGVAYRRCSWCNHRMLVTQFEYDLEEFWCSLSCEEDHQKFKDRQARYICETKDAEDAERNARDRY